MDYNFLKTDNKGCTSIVKGEITQKEKETSLDNKIVWQERSQKIRIKILMNRRQNKFPFPFPFPWYKSNKQMISMKNINKERLQTKEAHFHFMMVFKMKFCHTSRRRLYNQKQINKNQEKSLVFFRKETVCSAESSRLPVMASKHAWSAASARICSLLFNSSFVSF